ncbi:MAG: SPOR domain-containing protein [Burkholderiales bacterium]|nr:SPOR domain-containing protein [Burkholderiales bacterium]
MGLLSLFKQKQETSVDQDNGEFRSRAEDETNQARARGKKDDAPRNGKAGKAADPVLPEKKRARRRLIGAVALVLAAVIGLPMILDSEPKPLADDIAIQIPSKDKPLAASAAPEPAAGRNNSAAANESIEEIIDPAPVDKKTPAGHAAGVPDAALPPVAKNNAPATVTPLQDKGAKTDRPLEAKPEARAAAAEVKAALAPNVKTSGKDNFDGKPGEHAKPAIVKTAPAGDEAARAMAILEGKAPPKAASKPESAAKSSYVVQVAALASQEKVRELQSRLKAANIPSHTQKVATTSGEIIRVKVGPFDSKEEADKVRANLLKLGLNGNLIAN